jgi:hypothetical protein
MEQEFSMLIVAKGLGKVPGPARTISSDRTAKPGLFGDGWTEAYLIL